MYDMQIVNMYFVLLNDGDEHETACFDCEFSSVMGDILIGGLALKGCFYRGWHDSHGLSSRYPDAGP